MEKDRLRQCPAGPDEIAAVIADAQAGLPKGFTLHPIDTPGKPTVAGFIIRGPKTEGHKAGEVIWRWDLGRGPVPASVKAGVKQSCTAWANEPPLVVHTA